MAARKPGVSARTRNKELPDGAQRARLKLAMEEADLNQVRLGELAKVDQGAISRWLKGRRDMASLQLVRVAHVAGVRLDWLLSGHEPKAMGVVSGGGTRVTIDPAAAGDPSVNARAAELRSDPPRATEDRLHKNRRRART